MRADRAMIALHIGAVLVALAAALAWPRAGQAALLVPLGTGGANAALDWAEAEDTNLLALDTRQGRVIARVGSNASLLRALSAGLVPIAVRTPGCRPQETR